jgi:hypothetical protein
MVTWSFRDGLRLGAPGSASAWRRSAVRTVPLGAPLVAYLRAGRLSRSTGVAPRRMSRRGQGSLGLAAVWHAGFGRRLGEPPTEMPAGCPESTSHGDGRRPPLTPERGTRRFRWSVPSRWGSGRCATCRLSRSVHRGERRAARRRRLGPTIRAVRAWLALDRGAALVAGMVERAPPRQLQAAINSVGTGCGLHLYVPN